MTNSFHQILTHLETCARIIKNLPGSERKPMIDHVNYKANSFDDDLSIESEQEQLNLVERLVSIHAELKGCGVLMPSLMQLIRNWIESLGEEHALIPENTLTHVETYAKIVKHLPYNERRSIMDRLNYKIGSLEDLSTTESEQEQLNVIERLVSVHESLKGCGVLLSSLKQVIRDQIQLLGREHPDDPAKDEPEPKAESDLDRQTDMGKSESCDDHEVEAAKAHGTKVEDEENKHDISITAGGSSSNPPPTEPFQSDTHTIPLSRVHISRGSERKEQDYWSRPLELFFDGERSRWIILNPSTLSEIDDKKRRVAWFAPSDVRMIGAVGSFSGRWVVVDLHKPHKSVQLWFDEEEDKLAFEARLEKQTGIRSRYERENFWRFVEE